MNEESTKDLPGKKSFEERVFARLDAFDARFDRVDARFDKVNARFDTINARFDTVDARLEKLEARAYDTKPIWERALARIMDVGLEMGEVKGKVNVIENRLGVVESDVAAMRTDYASLRNHLESFKQELTHQLTRRLDLVLRTLVDQRDELRAAEDRITQLESKLA